MKIIYMRKGYEISRRVKLGNMKSKKGFKCHQKDVSDTFIASSIKDLILAWRVLGKRDEDKVCIADRIIELFGEEEF